MAEHEPLFVVVQESRLIVQWGVDARKVFGTREDAIAWAKDRKAFHADEAVPGWPFPRRKVRFRLMRMQAVTEEVIE